MSQSEEISRSFYAELGADGLAKRTRPEWDVQIVAALIELLPHDARVLDVGCGYGRIALPLARAGYEVEGLDLSENLVEAARGAADAEGLRINVTVGSMTSLPYPSESFDAVICLWSAFNELLEEDEQTRTVRELWRVLRPGGVGVTGILNPHYRHDERSFRRICGAAGVERFGVYERECGGRQRLFLRLDKQR